MDEHLELLKKHNFKKQLNELNKKLKNKKVLLYGAGSFFKKIQDNFDLSKLNIIGISDGKYPLNRFNHEEFGYKIVPFLKINEVNPDCILISTLNAFDIYIHLKKNFDNKYLILPLYNKPFFDLLREVIR